jgi:hypothetical protein
MSVGECEGIVDGGLYGSVGKYEGWAVGLQEVAPQHVV